MEARGSDKKVTLLRRNLSCLRLAIVCSVAIQCAYFCASPSAYAAFTRPFVRQLARAENESPETNPPRSGLSCSKEAVKPASCLVPRGIAVDSTSKLWVGDGAEAAATFGSNGVFSSLVQIGAKKGTFTTPDSLAFDTANGHVYLAGGSRRVESFTTSGEFVQQWPEVFGGELHLTIDNSSNPLDPSRESVYVAQEKEGESPKDAQGVGRFNAAGTPLEFSFTHECEVHKCSYIEGNEIVGTPSGRFGLGAPQGVAVDSEGDIYIVGGGTLDRRSEVDEYLPSGAFLRALSGAETPGLRGGHEFNGFGGQLQTLAIDPVSNHLLVGVAHEHSEGAAIDEFDSTGRFLNQITQTEVEIAFKKRVPGSLQSVPFGNAAFAVTTDSQGDVYVVDEAERVIDEYGPGKFLPSFRPASATELSPEGAQLNQFVDPEGLKLTDCRFEYVTQTAFETTGFENLSSGGQMPCSSPSASEVVANREFQLVGAKVGKLISGMTYRYRLSATTSASELGGTAFSESMQFTATHAPSVESQSVANISSRFAELHATINPLGASTHYHFEYGVGDGVWTSSPVPDEAIGRGGQGGALAVQVTQNIGALVA